MTLFLLDPSLARGVFEVETVQVGGADLRLVRGSSRDQLDALLSYEQDFPSHPLPDRGARGAMLELAA